MSMKVIDSAPKISDVGNANASMHDLEGGLGAIFLELDSDGRGKVSFCRSLTVKRCSALPGNGIFCTFINVLTNCHC